MSAVKRLNILLVIIGLSIVSFAAFGAESNETAPFALTADAKKYALILAGPGIDSNDSETIKKHAMDLHTILTGEYGYTAQTTTMLVGRESKKRAIAGPSRAENIRQSVAAMAKKVRPTDQLLIVFLGHASGNGENAKFNIVGPDLTVTEYAEIFKPIKTPHVIVFNTTAASFDLAKALSGTGRVAVSATRSSAEKYATLFPHYFIEGLKDHRADRDKNGRVSVLEIFSYTKTRVGDAFKEEGILATEHASIDDNGDGVFSLDPGRQPDGRIAEVAYLDVLGQIEGPNAPEARELRQAMNVLERDIFLLRSQKAQLPEADYWQQLEPLLIDLARTTQRLNGM